MCKTPASMRKRTHQSGSGWSSPFHCEEEEPPVRVWPVLTLSSGGRGPTSLGLAGPHPVIVRKRTNQSGSGWSSPCHQEEEDQPVRVWLVLTLSSGGRGPTSQGLAGPHPVIRRKRTNQSGSGWSSPCHREEADQPVRVWLVLTLSS
ncbi:hypothetical protein NHX12_022395 [Muraenolepis orangiensis]|uniref:Uncharacterized protein n=1 Tax=Muraenolepis orangiensis TaxID=630683 RepID=A0A9Q0IR88_9TELE|nr:hypothetical protein NHX12_022395 [Muraenolepis orangiensis]